MKDTFNRVGAIAGWENEGGALEPIISGDRHSVAYFRDREALCRSRANECRRPEMRSTYLGFAARYAALARYLDAAEIRAEMTIV